MSNDLEALYALAENLEQSSALLLKGNTDLRVAIDRAAGVIGDAGTKTQATLKAELTGLAKAIREHQAVATVALKDLTASRTAMQQDILAALKPELAAVAAGFRADAQQTRDAMVAAQTAWQQAQAIAERQNIFRLIVWVAPLILAVLFATLIHRWWEEPKTVVRQDNYVCTGKPKPDASNCRFWNSVPPPAP